MGTKYIIEVEDKPFELLSEDGFTSEKLFRVKGFNSLVFDMTGISKLTPYTEPDTEQVRKEAYDKGYDDATAEIGSDEQAIAEKAYQKGLSDAWDAARTLWNTPNRKEIFGHTTFNTVLTTLTAQETIEKIRQYEQEKEEEIQVGDEVATDAGNRASVLYENPDGTQVFVFKSDGTAAWWTKSALHRTGRNFFEIATVLEKMRGE